MTYAEIIRLKINVGRFGAKDHTPCYECGFRFDQHWITRCPGGDASDQFCRLPSLSLIKSMVTS